MGRGRAKGRRSKQKTTCLQEEAKLFAVFVEESFYDQPLMGFIL